MQLDRLDHVAGAAGIKPTVVAKEGTDGDLVQPYQQNQKVSDQAVDHMQASLKRLLQMIAAGT
ncbi:hypothetical protein GCM10009109_03070 [Marinobacterium sediminicola]